MTHLWQSGPSHLGDCIWSVIALRRIPGHHIFYVNPEYIPQLRECCDDADIDLLGNERPPAEARCTWIGCQRFAGQGLAWHLQPDLIHFLMQWNNLMCRECGTPPQFNTRRDMLADFAAIRDKATDADFDALVINCPPRSGQCPRWGQGQMDDLIFELGRNHRVICTNETKATNVRNIGATVCQIGNLSLRAKFIVAVASGAHWCIHNVWNQEVPKYLFLDTPLALDYGKQIPHHGLVAGMRQQLITEGWL